MSPVLLGLMIAIAVVFVLLVLAIIAYIKGGKNSEVGLAAEDGMDDEDDNDLIIIKYDEEMTYDSNQLPNNVLQSIVRFHSDAQDVICSLITEFAIANDFRLADVAILDVMIPDDESVGEISLVCGKTEMVIRVAVGRGMRAGYMYYEYVEDEEDEDEV